MEPEEYLKTLSLESLTKLLSKGTTELLAAKISNNDPEETEYLQNVVDLIQKVIVETRAQLPPVKY